MMRVGDSNIELFGMTEGRYDLAATLVDREGLSRNCWTGDEISFRIESTPLDERNRSSMLLRGLQSLGRDGGRVGQILKDGWLRQPRTHSDFGYVTAVWGDKYIDNVLAW